VQPEVQVRQLWLLLCVPLTLIDTSNHKAQTFSVLSMETRPELHRHDHVHEQEAQEGEEDAAVMEHGAALSLQRGATLFGRRHDEEAGRRRGEIREVDFFSRDSGARGHDDGGGRGAPGGGRDDINVSLPDLDHQLLARLLRIAEIKRLYDQFPFILPTV